MMGKDPGGDIVVHRSIADHLADQSDDAMEARAAAASGAGGAIASAISKSALLDGFKKTLVSDATAGLLVQTERDR